MSLLKAWSLIWHLSRGNCFPEGISTWCCWSNAVEKGERGRKRERDRERKRGRRMGTKGWRAHIQSCGAGSLRSTATGGRTNRLHASLACRKQLCQSKNWTNRRPYFDRRMPLTSCAEGWACWTTGRRLNNFNRCLLEMKQNGFFPFLSFFFFFFFCFFFGGKKKSWVGGKSALGCGLMREGREILDRSHVWCKRRLIKAAEQLFSLSCQIVAAQWLRISRLMWTPVSPHAHIHPSLG